MTLLSLTVSSTITATVSSTVFATVRQYLRTYERYAVDFWDNLTPMQYGLLLIFVSVSGYLLMRSSR
jgi:hypothetical protein